MRRCTLCGGSLEGDRRQTLTCSPSCRREAARARVILAGAGAAGYATLAEYQGQTTASNKPPPGGGSGVARSAAGAFGDPQLAPHDRQRYAPVEQLQQLLPDELAPPPAQRAHVRLLTAAHRRDDRLQVGA